MSIDLPNPPQGDDDLPENVIPFDSAGTEISEESLRELNELMDRGPGENASEEEVAAFMQKILQSEAGAAMIDSFSEQLKEGGLLDEILNDDEVEAGPEYIPLESPARLVFRIELLNTNPAIWRRISLPGDASFLDLHCAIQDSFGWQDKHLHRFELRGEKAIEATFSSSPGLEIEDENDYCGVENRVVDVCRSGWPEFHYVYDFGDDWVHSVTLEDIIGAGQDGSSKDLTPTVHDGEGLCPPEDCGGFPGFQMLLSGEGGFADEYPPEFLEKLREGKFHPPAVRFRDPKTVLQEWHSY